MSIPRICNQSVTLSVVKIGMSQSIAKEIKMCPFSRNKHALCKDALSSSMIDNKVCFSEAYTICPIFLINKSRQDIDSRIPLFRIDNHIRH